jgi:hypothetical protein
MHELAATQPVEQRVAIGCIENVRDRVAAMQVREPRRYSEQMQIVIA